MLDQNSREVIGWILNLLTLVFMGLVAWFNTRLSRMEKDAISIAAATAAMTVKVDTMWQFQMRRAIGEIGVSGIGTVNSPVKIKPEIMRCIDPIKPDLVRLYQQSGFRGDSTLNQLLIIERLFGDKLLTEICLPYNLTQGACLITALMVAQGKDEMEIDI